MIDRKDHGTNTTIIVHLATLVRYALTLCGNNSSIETKTEI